MIVRIQMMFLHRKRFRMLSAWQICVNRYPHLSERIVIGTAPYDFKGFIGYRNFVMKTKEGEVLSYNINILFPNRYLSQPIFPASIKRFTNPGIKSRLTIAEDYKNSWIKNRGLEYEEQQLRNIRYTAEQSGFFSVLLWICQH